VRQEVKHLRTAHMNADRQLTAREPANEDVIPAAAERKLWRSSRDIAQELGLSQPRVIEVLHDDQLHPYNFLRSALLFPGDRPIQLLFCECLQQHNADKPFLLTPCGEMKHVLRVRVCSSFTAATSGHGMILMLSANVGIKSTSASVFGLK
jgi:hypothetical protein